MSNLHSKETTELISWSFWLNFYGKKIKTFSSNLVEVNISIIYKDFKILISKVGLKFWLRNELWVVLWLVEL